MNFLFYTLLLLKIVFHVKSVNFGMRQSILMTGNLETIFGEILDQETSTDVRYKLKFPKTIFDKNQCQQVVGRLDSSDQNIFNIDIVDFCYYYPINDISVLFSKTDEELVALEKKCTVSNYRKINISYPKAYKVVYNYFFDSSNVLNTNLTVFYSNGQSNTNFINLANLPLTTKILKIEKVNNELILDSTILVPTINTPVTECCFEEALEFINKMFDISYHFCWTSYIEEDYNSISDNHQFSLKLSNVTMNLPTGGETYRGTTLWKTCVNNLENFAYNTNDVNKMAWNKYLKLNYGDVNTETYLNYVIWTDPTNSFVCVNDKNTATLEIKFNAKFFNCVDDAEFYIDQITSNTSIIAKQIVLKNGNNQSNGVAKFDKTLKLVETNNGIIKINDLFNYKKEIVIAAFRASCGLDLTDW